MTSANRFCSYYDLVSQVITHKEDEIIQFLEEMSTKRRAHSMCTLFRAAKILETIAQWVPQPLATELAVLLASRSLSEVQNEVADINS